MSDLRKAAEMAVGYIVEALARHDEAYERHPSTEHERQVIIKDLEALRKALLHHNDYLKNALEEEWRNGYRVGKKDAAWELVYYLEAKLKEKNT